MYRASSLWQSNRRGAGNNRRGGGYARRRPGNSRSFNSRYDDYNSNDYDYNTNNNNNKRGYNRNNSQLEILQRLDQMQKHIDDLHRGRGRNFGSYRGKNKRNHSTSSSGSHPGFFSDHPSSNNPDFKELSKQLFQLALLENAKVTWVNPPETLERAVRGVTQSVRPPCPNDKLHSELNKAGYTFLKNLSEIANRHIDLQISALTADINKLNHTDFDMAKSVAASYLRKRLGSNFPPEDLELLMDTAGEYISESTPLITGPALPRPILKKRKPDESPAPHIADVEGAPFKIVNVISELSGVSLDDGASTDQADASATATKPQPKRHKVEHSQIIHRGPKCEWKIARSVQQNAVLLGDSNLKLARSAPGLDINSLPGANLNHVVQVLTNWRPTDERDKLFVVIQAGINHREDTKENIDELIKKLHKLKEDTSSYIRLYVLGVSIPPGLPREQAETLSFLNQRMFDLVGGLQFIEGLDTGDVNILADDFSGIHYDQATVDSIVDIVLRHLYPLSFF